MARNIVRKLWITVGRIGFLLARYPISVIVRNSKRTRILVVCDNEYLVVKHWLGDNSWMLPGGGLHRGEDPLDAAKRELKEEVGLEPATDKFMHVGRFDCRDGHFKFQYDLYIVQLAEKPRLQLQRIEILSADWFVRKIVPPGKACPELGVALQHWP